MRLITPFIREFVDALKETVPWRYRSYDGDSRTWTIEEPYASDALALALDYYGDMEEVYTEAAVQREIAKAFKTHTCHATATPSPHGTDECLRRVRHLHQEHAALYLLPGAPWPLVQAAYRALALLVHPDRGGSHQAMVDVNRAYESLERRQVKA